MCRGGSCSGVQAEPAGCRVALDLAEVQGEGLLQLLDLGAVRHEPGETVHVGVRVLPDRLQARGRTGPVLVGLPPVPTPMTADLLLIAVLGEKEPLRLLGGEAREPVPRAGTDSPRPSLVTLSHPFSLGRPWASAPTVAP